MSKHDDDSSADIEVGMTTAERRRRRRRGGSLRVPSDNVPRRTPPVVAPVPEDPSLAMSIAYSFSSEASEPVPRVTVETPVPKFDSESGEPIAPMAPESMPTVIDPPSSTVEHADFEMKTREMSAVDLEALGLAEPGFGRASSDQLPGVSAKLPHAGTPPAAAVDVDVGGLEVAAPEQDDQAHSGGRKGRRERLQTMALSDDDLEEVRESLRAQTRAETVPIAATSAPRTAAPIAVVARAEEASGKTQPLTAADLEQMRTAGEEPLSVPEIDIQMLADRADSSGEFEVDVDDEGDADAELQTTPQPAVAATATPLMAPLVPAVAVTAPP
ncbi:MAG: hypothetical protein M3680_30950, partial [Myxococcota bacterium]|nr:hypothetical protein [Myxococcota bacterium]